MAYTETMKGLWIVDIVLKFRVDGKQKKLRERKTVKGSERKAKKVEFEIKSKLENERAEFLSSTGCLKYQTFGECLEEYLTNKRSSWDKYQIDKVSNELGEVSLDELTEKFDRWFEIVKLEPTINGTLPTVSSTNKPLTLSKAATAHCYKRGYIDKDPLRMFTKEVENNKRNATISDIEFMRLFKILPEWLKPITQFSYLVTTRGGELKKAEPKHVDLSNQLLFIPAENTKKKRCERWLPIPDSLVNYVKNIPENCPWVFYREDSRGKIHQLKDFHSTWDRALVKAKIEDFHFHDLRGVSTTRMQENGIPSLVVDYIAGWNLGTMRERYRRPFAARVLHEAVGNQQWLEAHQDTGINNKNLLFG